MSKISLWKKDEIDLDGYYRHGICGKILLRVDKNTNLNNAYCYCRACHKEIKLETIENGKIKSNIPQSKMA